MIATRSGSTSSAQLERRVERAARERERPQVQIREMEDAQPVEAGREAGQRDVERAPLEPLRFVEPPASGGERPEAEAGAPSRYGASIFASMGSTETTCRLNLSSESSIPAATPTSCDRWRIGIP